MAFLQNLGPAGLRMNSFDFSIVEGMTLLQHSATTLSWVTLGGDSVTIGGRGINAVVTGGMLADVTQGSFETLNLRVGQQAMTVAGWEIAGAAFYDLVQAENWKGLAALMVSGDDVIIGGAAKDVIVAGAGNDFLSGEAGNDKLSGGAKQDLLHGGAGNDTMTGGSGGDMFYFDFAPTKGGVDTITDFAHHSDKFAINHLLFPNVGPQGIMTNNWFYSTAQAAEGRQGIIYDKDTGEVFSDADGIGSAPRVLFALVDPGTNLTASDFLVY